MLTTRTLSALVGLAVLALAFSADVASATRDCLPRNYGEQCLSIPTLTNASFQRFHAGILATVFVLLGMLFTYRLIYNFRVVPWRQSSVFLTCLLSCIFHVVWLTKSVKNIQQLQSGIAYEALADVTFTFVICCLFGYMMKLDDEIRQHRVHWRIVVQWILLAIAAVIQLAKIYHARAGDASATLWLNFVALLVLSITTADRCLLLMKLLPPTQRNTHPWFRKVNFMTFFFAICLFINMIIGFYHAVDQEVEVAKNKEENQHQYACMPIEFLSVRVVALVVAPLMVVLTGLWDDPRTVLAVKRLESRKSSSITSRVDAFVNRYWRTMTFILLISLITLGMAGWGGSATCHVPHATVALISLFMARVGATPFYILFPAVFVMVLNGFNTSLESTMLGSFLPRANGSLVVYHKYVGWLCIIAMFFHVGGHIGTLFAYHRFITGGSDTPSDPTTTTTTAAPGPTIRPIILEYFDDIFNFRGGPWMLPWFTGVAMTVLMLIVAASYYVLSKRKHKKFKKWHVWSAYATLALGSIHGAAKILGMPYLWVVFLVVSAVSILDFLWCRRQSERVRCDMKELTTPGARGRVEVVLVLRFRCKKLKFYPGDYLLLRVPQISVSDQHPFTIVCNVPEDEYELHIKVSDLKVNAWTRALTSMLDFKYGRIMAGHSYQLNRAATDNGTELQEHLLSNQNDDLPTLLDSVSCSVDAEVIGGFKSSLADGDFINGDFVIMVGFSVGATPMCAYLNRLPESRYEELRDNVWFFHRSEFYIKPGSPPAFGAYGGYIKEVCQQTEKRLGRDANGPAGPILQSEAGESRDVFWNRLHDRVAECLQKLPPGGRIHIGYCGSLQGLDALYDSLDRDQLAAHRAVKFYIESFG
eukprot:m.105150 g.105150  ORF g.105150 m.105150 type:complete len:872 (-) comp15103_c0_seq1:335-2950(-)